MSNDTGWLHGIVAALNAHDIAAMVAHLSDDVRYADIALGEEVTGPAAVEQLFRTIETNLSSDYRIELGRIAVDDGESFAYEWTMTGTNDRADPERGLPSSGRPFSIPGVSIGRRRGGKVVESRDYWNLAGYLAQVGVLPAPEAATAAST